MTELEIGAGGYAPHPHCDVAALLAGGQAARLLRAAIEDAADAADTALEPA